MGCFFDSYGKDDVLYYIGLRHFPHSHNSLQPCVDPHPKGLRSVRSTDRPVHHTDSAAQYCGFYEYAGRWSVGFLWAFLTEVLIIEFVVEAYRWALTFFKV